MHKRAIINSADPSFKDFLWKNKWNRAFLLLGVLAIVLQFIIFKLLYPFANYFVDSYYYLEAAYHNSDINMWPVGYSKILRLFSVFTHSDMVVVACQYTFLQISGLLFLSSLFYFIRPGKIIIFILYIAILFNPLSLYLSNYISPDSIFTGLSLLWITQLLWIIYKPAARQIFIQGLLLMLLFTIRYNAIYYPLIAALAFILSPQRIWFKTAGIVIGSALVAFSILYTSNKMHEETGYRQFSAFSGWQIANNALYAYEHVPSEQTGSIPARFAKLEQMVKEHKDTLSRVKLTHIDSMHTYFYLWSSRGPLMQYMTREWKKDTTTPYFKKWAAEGPLYKDYALYLIRKHPMEFLQYFIWPNALKFATPPVEFLGVYNMGSDSVERGAKEWFGYKSLKIKHYFKDHDVTILRWYPVLSALVNIFFLISLVGFVVFKGIQKSGPGFSKALILIVVLWITNMAFSIFASPIVLRYQVFPGILCFAFSFLSIRFVDLKE